MTEKVIAVYGVKYISYTVEYFEEHTKTWLAAAGKFPSGMTVRGFYDDPDAAKMVAKQLADAEDKVTRVLKKEESK